MTRTNPNRTRSRSVFSSNFWAVTLTPIGRSAKKHTGTQWMVLVEYGVPLFDLMKVRLFGTGLLVSSALDVCEHLFTAWGPRH